MKLMATQEILAKKQNIQLSINTPLNINFTEKLVQNLYESNLSWSQISSKFDDFVEDIVNFKKNFGLGKLQIFKQP
jgi:hypothetical protein